MLEFYMKCDFGPIGDSSCVFYIHIVRNDLHDIIQSVALSMGQMKLHNFLILLPIPFVFMNSEK